MGKRIFVSYNFGDRELAHNAEQLLRKGTDAPVAQAVFVSDLPSDAPEDEIRKAIDAAIARCDGVLFVVGDDNHNSPWIDHEVRQASRRGLRSVAVQVKDTAGGVPNSLKGHVRKPLPWEPDVVASAVAGILR